jgi:hypothetical protein
MMKPPSPIFPKPSASYGEEYIVPKAVVYFNVLNRLFSIVNPEWEPEPKSKTILLESELEL